jgi:ribosomal protein L40E
VYFGQTCDIICRKGWDYTGSHLCSCNPDDSEGGCEMSGGSCHRCPDLNQCSSSFNGAGQAHGDDGCSCFQDNIDSTAVGCDPVPNTCYIANKCRADPTLDTVLKLGTPEFNGLAQASDLNYVGHICQRCDASSPNVWTDYAESPLPECELCADIGTTAPVEFDVKPGFCVLGPDKGSGDFQCVTDGAFLSELYDDADAVNGVTGDLDWTRVGDGVCMKCSHSNSPRAWEILGTTAACEWTKPDDDSDTATNIKCNDGSTCPFASDGWGCCAGKGGKKKCPVGYNMCQDRDSDRRCPLGTNPFAGGAKCCRTDKDDTGNILSYGSTTCQEDAASGNSNEADCPHGADPGSCLEAPSSPLTGEYLCAADCAALGGDRVCAISTGATPSSSPSVFRTHVVPRPA